MQELTRSTSESLGPGGGDDMVVIRADQLVTFVRHGGEKGCALGMAVE